MLSALQASCVSLLVARSSYLRSPKCSIATGIIVTSKKKPLQCENKVGPKLHELALLSGMLQYDDYLEFVYMNHPFEPNRRIFVAHRDTHGAKLNDGVLVQLHSLDKWLVSIPMKDKYNSSILRHVPMRNVEKSLQLIQSVLKAEHNLSYTNNMMWPNPAVMPHSAPNLIPTGTVLHVTQKAEQRFIGKVRITKLNKPIFISLDKSIPPIPLLSNALVKEVLKHPEKYEDTKFWCELISFSESSRYIKGYLVDKVEMISDIETATETILKTYGIHFGEFKSEILEDLPKSPSDFVISQSEIDKRADFRGECVFTIDPPTAKDLDDALHIKKLDNGLFEVGVHVADVSYFVKEDSPLDHEAAKRATTVYMVQRAIPMLPSILSEHLCSLNPHGDRLTFSVVFTIDEHGSVVESEIKRSIIKSCARLSYEQAQEIIDDKKTPTKPIEVSKPFDLSHVIESTKLLHKIAQNLRRERFEKGALSLANAEIQFIFPDDHLSTSEDTYPSGFKVKAPSAASNLIEEWMLLANQTTAHFLMEHFASRSNSPSRGDTDRLGSVLRRHPAPKTHELKSLSHLIKPAGFDLDTSSPGSLQSSVKAVEMKDISEGRKPDRFQALSYMCYRRMQLALYFCLETQGSNLSQDKLYKWAHHYGLNVPNYTHFTSPIRRYADLVVHRRLIEILYPEPQLSPSHSGVNAYQKTASQTDVCNQKKLIGKRAQEASSHVFLAAWLRNNGPMDTYGVLCAITNKEIEIFFPEIGFVKKLKYHTFPTDQLTVNMADATANRLRSVSTKDTPPVTTVVLNWHPTSTGCPHNVVSSLHVLDRFSCRLTCHPDYLSISVMPLSPPCPTCQTTSSSSADSSHPHSNNNIYCNNSDVETKL